MEKSRSMRLIANLPYSLWKEVLNTAVYLHNRLPREAQTWKSPYEVFFSSVHVSGPKPIQKKPQLAHKGVRLQGLCYDEERTAEGKQAEETRFLSARWISRWIRFHEYIQDLDSPP